MKMEAVLFDYGNTLLEYRDFSLEAFGGRLRESIAALAGQIDGGEFDVDRLTRGVWRRMEEVEARACVDLLEYDASAEILRALARETAGAVAIDAEWDARVDREVFGVMRRALAPEAKAVGMLRALRERGLKLGLVSNSQFRSANHRQDLRRDGMLELLDATVFSVDIGVRKPRAEIFRAALEGVGVADGRRVVFVGDSVQADVAGARALGMRTILARTPDNAGADDGGADATISDLDEIPALIDDWSRDGKGMDYHEEL